MTLLVHCDNMKNNLKPFSWALLGLVVSLQWEIWEMPFISVVFGLPQKPKSHPNFDVDGFVFFFSKLFPQQIALKIGSSDFLEQIAPSNWVIRFFWLKLTLCATPLS